jgi:enamine deaminase RidA (YjgF/YER057c/UK114 family)
MMPKQTRFNNARSSQTYYTKNTMNQPKFFVTPGYGEYMLNKLHYSQAVKIGDQVETSGQGGIDDNLQIPELLSDEIAQTFRNVERTLATAGGAWEHVVHVNSYHVGGFPPEVIAVDRALKTFRWIGV